MPMFRRAGRPGLVGLVARTAVVAGDAGLLRDDEFAAAKTKPLG